MFGAAPDAEGSFDQRSAHAESILSALPGKAYVAATTEQDSQNLDPSNRTMLNLKT
jgi:hypothetical protein